MLLVGNTIFCYILRKKCHFFDTTKLCLYCCLLVKSIGVSGCLYTLHVMSYMICHALLNLFIPTGPDMNEVPDPNILQDPAMDDDDIIDDHRRRGDNSSDDDRGNIITIGIGVIVIIIIIIIIIITVTTIII